MYFHLKVYVLFFVFFFFIGFWSSSIFFNNNFALMVRDVILKCACVYICMCDTLTYKPLAMNHSRFYFQFFKIFFFLLSNSHAEDNEPRVTIFSLFSWRVIFIFKVHRKRFSFKLSSLCRVCKKFASLPILSIFFLLCLFFFNKI